MLAVKIHCELGLNIFFSFISYKRKFAYLSFGNSTHPQLASAMVFVLPLAIWKMKKWRRFGNNIATWLMPVSKAVSETTNR
jgi:hypothetical protein